MYLVPGTWYILFIVVIELCLLGDLSQAGKNARFILDNPDSGTFIGMKAVSDKL